MRHLIKNKNKRKRFAHIGAGIVILIHSYEKFSAGHDSFIAFMLAGFVFMIIALLHPVIEKKAPWIDGVFFLIEGVLSIIVALDFFHAGKKALPISYIFLALFQFYIAFKRSKKGIEHHNMSIKT